MLNSQDPPVGLLLNFLSFCFQEEMVSSRLFNVLSSTLTKRNLSLKMLWNMSAFPLPPRLACKLFFIAGTRLNWIQSFVFFFNSPETLQRARRDITSEGGGGRNNRGTPRHQSIWPRRGHAIYFSIDQLVIGLPRISHEWRKTVDELKWNKRALKKRWHV